MNPKKSISAIVIARNEAKRLPACLKALSWTEEIIVVDNDSTDDTAKIAVRYGAIVISQKTSDFSVLRNAGFRHAHGDWLLYVDADEIVTPALHDEIAGIIHTPHYSSFYIPRENYYLGTKWPSRDGMVRLIRKDALVHWAGDLHEHPEVRGEIGRLHNYFIHTTHRTLEEMVSKTNEWSNIEAELRFKVHHPTISWWRLLRVMLTAFFNSLITQGGWKAGTAGWIESMYQAFSMFISYAKLWELQLRKK